MQLQHETCHQGFMHSVVPNPLMCNVRKGSYLDRINLINYQGKQLQVRSIAEGTSRSFHGLLCRLHHIDLEGLLASYQSLALPDLMS